MEETKHCFFCNDTGYWESEYSKQTLFCPFCKPTNAEHQGLAHAPLSTWGKFYWPHILAKYRGPRFQVEPWLLVIHSGSISDAVAEYFSNPRDDRVVSAHLAWSRKLGGFAQCVPFSHVAWHCGGSSYMGLRRLNFYSIGIELPGPWNKERNGNEHRDITCAVGNLLGMVPSLTTVVRHSDINSNKKDPGPGFKMECLEGLGLKLEKSD